MSTTIEMASEPSASLSGAGLAWPLHPACSAWPEMSRLELRDLADDIATHGLRDPITLTPDNLLLDGRNRALACVMAAVEPTTVIYDGDPWVFSLSRNKHRRHMSVDQIAMVAATMATATHGGDRGNQYTGGKSSNEPLAPVSAAKAAETAGVPETAVKSAKIVLKAGTAKEIAAVRAGEAKVRATADRVRERLRASALPKSAKAASNVDPIDVVASEINAKCSDGKWKSISKIATAVKEPSAAKEALKILGPERVETRPNGIEIEYRITRDDETDMRRLLAAKDAEIADLKKRIAEHELEIERLTEQLTAPNVSTPPTRKRQRAEPKPASTPPSTEQHDRAFTGAVSLVSSRTFAVGKKSDRQSANTDAMFATMADAKALALKLANTCKRSDVEPFTMIMALSILLGATIGSVGKGNEIVDLAIATMHRAIATRGDDDRAGGLQ